jgi:hypothetical protein
MENKREMTLADHILLGTTQAKTYAPTPKLHLHFLPIFVSLERARTSL